MFIASLIFITIGVFCIVFAYRDPPASIDHWFRIPAIFIFFPEHNRVRLGRLTLGGLLVLAGIVDVIRELYHQIHWLIAR